MKRLLNHGIARSAAAGVSFLMMSCVVSCSGPSGPDLHDLSGTVTFDGRPVGSGKMTFMPDHQAGNSGPAGYADIRDGKFNTRQSGRGTVGGPHIVQIDGYSEEMETFFDADADEEVKRPKVLFRGYEKRVDMPASRSTLDFDIPASAAPSAR